MTPGNTSMCDPRLTTEPDRLRVQLQPHDHPQQIRAIRATAGVTS